MTYLKSQTYKVKELQVELSCAFLMVEDEVSTDVSVTDFMTNTVLL